jgi:hypothetical protein
MTDTNALTAFQWSRQPEAEAFLRGTVADFLERLPAAKSLADRMARETGTRFFDWIDLITLPDSPATRERLRAIGFSREDLPGEIAVLRNGAGMFPRVGLTPIVETRIAIKVDSVAEFLAINQIERAIEGRPFGVMRSASIVQDESHFLDVVERRGTWASAVSESSGGLNAVEHLERFRMRRRDFEDDAAGFEHTAMLVDMAVSELGPDRAAAQFFTAEREFWQRRNRAAQVQKARQDRLGLGWANHDHHTYRSSRVYFHRLIALFEKMGMECRERFYAGREAGWGAQVMENPRAGIITFNDVDLAPEEVLGDFAHEPLAARETLGTVGLWCGLHGEALLQAGMHHLECQFDFEALKIQLESEHGIAVMKPFTDFPYLRQAFTEGERWPVSPERVRRLRKTDLITAEQAEKFLSQGAIGSHLENLERNEGYKGFNQKGVSEIIAATDPRRQVTV